MPPERINNKSVHLRPGGPADGQKIYRVFKFALGDLQQRLNIAPAGTAPSEAELADGWSNMRSLFQHLADTASHFWVAEQENEIVGFARTIEHDGVRELTEFFVHPAAQSAGLGRALLEHAFPAPGARHRCVLATPDLRGLARYLKSGVLARFPIYNFERAPKPIKIPTDLSFEPVTATFPTLTALAELDQSILGFRRDADHRWLLQDRQGFLYRRNGHPIGYGYVGKYSGPFALLAEQDFPAVLAHAESAAAENGADEFSVNVPLINRVAVDYLLRRGYQIGPFFCYFMSDTPFGKFPNYLTTSPMFFL